MSLKNIGSELKAARKAKGVTQKTMAAYTGIVYSTISKMENGRYTGSVDLLEKYTNAVGLELTVKHKAHIFPRFDQLKQLFPEDD
jgi:transcriptional regulator with XRE-family HTH domain